MSTTIPQRDLRNFNAQIVARVAEGESFVVTRDGVPVADLVPHVETDDPPIFVRIGDLTAWLRGGDYDRPAWMNDIRRSDEFMDDDPFHDPWERRG